jgi:hypothetical protein
MTTPNHPHENQPISDGHGEAHGVVDGASERSIDSIKTVAEPVIRSTVSFYPQPDQTRPLGQILPGSSSAAWRSSASRG